MHLTNFSINKKNTKFVKNNDKKKNANDSSDQEDGPEDASKWDFKMLQQAFEKMGANYNQMYN